MWVVFAFSPLALWLVVLPLVLSSCEELVPAPTVFWVLAAGATVLCPVKLPDLVVATTREPWEWAVTPKEAPGAKLKVFGALNVIEEELGIVLSKLKAPEEALGTDTEEAKADCDEPFVEPKRSGWVAVLEAF